MSVTPKQKQVLKIAVEYGKVTQRQIRTVYVTYNSADQAVRNLVSQGYLTPDYGNYIPTQEAFLLLAGSVGKPKEKTLDEFQDGKLRLETPWTHDQKDLGRVVGVGRDVIGFGKMVGRNAETYIHFKKEDWPAIKAYIDDELSR